MGHFLTENATQTSNRLLHIRPRIAICAEKRLRDMKKIKRRAAPVEPARPHLTTLV